MTVAEEGQITRAAARLHIAQPALSQMVAKLEATVGVRLLDRHPRGVTLTPAGTAFFEKASLAVRSAQDAQAILGPFSRAEGALILGFTASFHRIARPIMRRFVESNREVQLHVRQLELSRRILDLRSGLVDVELLLVPDPPEADLRVETLFSSPRYVLLADEHPLARESSLVFDQIADETFPGRHPSAPSQWSSDAWLSDRRGADPQVTVETPLALDEVWALVYAGKCVAVLPGFMVPLTQGNGVSGIPLVDVEPIDVGLARRREDSRASVAALFAIAREVVIEGEGPATRRPVRRPRTPGPAASPSSAAGPDRSDGPGPAPLARRATQRHLNEEHTRTCENQGSCNRLWTAKDQL